MAIFAASSWLPQATSARKVQKLSAFGISSFDCPSVDCGRVASLPGLGLIVFVKVDWGEQVF